MPEPAFPINGFALRLQDFHQSAIKDTNVGTILK